MLETFLPIFLLAGLFYALRHLPAWASVHRRTRRLSQLAEAGWTFEYSRKTVSVYTTALNPLPKACVSSWQRSLQRVYDLGSVAGGIGGGMAIAGGLWALVSVWTAVWAEARLHAMETPVVEEKTVIKRAVQLLTETEFDAKVNTGGLEPLIPGVTVPLSHIPTILLALVLNQLLHELGHAFAAALDDVSPSRLSFNLHIFIPSMMVSFPSVVDSLPPRSRLRLASSGPWHNLLIWLCIVTLTIGGMGRLFWVDMSENGRVVQTVKPLSPLADHIRPGRIVTHLDDVFLGGTEDVWQSYLSGDEIGDAGRGWCIEKTAYEALPLAPCVAPGQIAFHETLETERSEDRCLAPHPILDTPSGPCPCPGLRWACVRPTPEEQLLRIQLEGRSRRREEVVLWAGDRQGVLQDVKVDTQGARFAGGLVRWVTLFVDYLSTIALSLFLFNLLPLPGSDGSHYLQALLSLRSRKPASSGAYPKPFQATLSSSSKHNAVGTGMLVDEVSDEEEGYEDEEGKRRGVEVRWKVRLRKGIEMGMVAVVLGWVAGWGMLALLRSS